MSLNSFMGAPLSHPFTHLHACPPDFPTTPPSALSPAEAQGRLEEVPPDFSLFREKPSQRLNVVLFCIWVKI